MTIKNIDNNILDLAINYVKVYNDYLEFYNNENDRMSHIFEEDDTKKTSEMMSDQMELMQESMKNMDIWAKKQVESLNKLKNSTLCDMTMRDFYIELAKSLISENYEKATSIRHLNSRNRKTNISIVAPFSFACPDIR